MTVLGYRALRGKAVRTEHNGVVYASKTEAAFAAHLDLAQGAGEIRGYLRQVPLHLPGGIVWRVDFLAYEDPNLVAHEVKGAVTRDFITRYKLARATYPWITFRVWQRRGKRWVEWSPEIEKTKRAERRRERGEARGPIVGVAVEDSRPVPGTDLHEVTIRISGGGA